MDRVPAEIFIQILDHLSYLDIIQLQRVSRRLLKLARDNALWKLKCFEDAPASVQNSLRGNSQRSAAKTEQDEQDLIESTKAYRIAGETGHRTQPTSLNRHESVDWYSEYIARHAPLRTIWADSHSSTTQEVRGLNAFNHGTRAVGPLEDGGICVWDISRSQDDERTFSEVRRSPSGTLFYSPSTKTSKTPGQLAFSSVTECINVNSHRSKAYIAVENVLNEIDLTTLAVISQHTYPWPITALSQDGEQEQPMTVGTQWSLNLYDPRVSIRDRSRSPEDMVRTQPANPENSIAFFSNYQKDIKLSQIYGNPLPKTFLPIPYLPITSPASRQLDSSNPRNESARNYRPRGREVSDFAKIEPGPLSIAHHSPHDILIAGRFPSILTYDRRYFPRLQHVIHSGARLSSLTILPSTLTGFAASASPDTVLVACGEYGGRGSLELYSIPDTTSSGTAVVNAVEDEQEGIKHLKWRELQNGMGEIKRPPYAYKNRQQASASKLLSVADHGTRIVFSDGEGGLKWVERDGRGLVRRWNINKFEMTPDGAALHGEQVVRKIIPLRTEASHRGLQGNDDLLVWTGERAGIVTTNSGTRRTETDEEQRNTDAAQLRAEAEEYDRMMRRALERQADERRWMSRFRLR